jgi:hypothetical protein
MCWHEEKTIIGTKVGSKIPPKVILVWQYVTVHKPESRPHIRLTFPSTPAALASCEGERGRRRENEKSIRRSLKHSHPVMRGQM